MRVLVIGGYGAFGKRIVKRINKIRGDAQAKLQLKFRIKPFSCSFIDVKF
jgi:hypothetical protein